MAINRELVIVGGGPAGMAAALSAYENGARDILILERDQFLGGILNQCIHTGFGIAYFKEVLTGPEYAGRFIGRLAKCPQIQVSLKSFVVKVGPERTLTYIRPGELVTVRARALIMATGCRERTREMVHIPGDRPAGIFSAGLAQKLINSEGLLPGKEVVIVGSGDIGLIMARRFVLEGAQVKAIVEIQGQSRGLVRNLVQCVEDFGIPLYLRHKVSRIYGRKRVEKVSVVQTDDQGRDIPASRFEIGCDTVLVSVGLIPENELLEAAGATIDPVRHTVENAAGAFETSLPGIFVCGNAFKVYDLVDAVTKDSEAAGKKAAEYIKRNR